MNISRFVKSTEAAILIDSLLNETYGLIDHILYAYEEEKDKTKLIKKANQRVDRLDELARALVEKYKKSLETPTAGDDV